jgi:hypothetical protein
MRHWKRALFLVAPIAAAAVAVVTVGSRGHAEDTGVEDLFPRGEHYLLPPVVPDFEGLTSSIGVVPLSDPNRDPGNEWVAYGTVSPVVAEQPINYSHKLHAGKLQIDCQYCHFNARRSIHAGVPTTDTCMNCHKFVSADGRSDEAQADIAKLKEYAASGEPIPWVKVHDVPDFVYFSHKRHVVGGVECQECHGEVQEDMTVAYRVAELTMGWCLNCHKEHPKVDENYGAQAELRRAELKDCWTCHK